ncbi:NAD dependent epimerase/dehydratase [Gymnopus androsaceus JB14]|uniref:NAD dependent epimerase/dehydratase n=1 Tax=Gymnopus androsaceus JB14 TaxID=1447944 RepID=A0A6A4GIM0_9AGAR|nr:NAD dependent epimerase/dehydratase [Gymnopus androsaceus JB14]
MVQVLILGGHGKVALHMTKILAAHSHKVTSIIRNPDHSKEIRDLHPEDSSLINPVVASIEETDEEGAVNLMKDIDWVVWSAGAGGKGGPERTKAVDEIAAKRFIKAAITAPSVKKFLMVSASSSRRAPASYWNDQDKAVFKKAWEAIGVYCEAKTVADEYLYTESRKCQSGKSDWVDICLRPGALSDSPGTGKVDLGRAKLAGSVPREDVAAVAVDLLEKENGGGLWIDLIGGEEPIATAVDRVVSQRITSRE